MLARTVVLVVQCAAVLQLTSAEGEVEVKEVEDIKVKIPPPDWPDWFNPRTCQVGSGCDNPCAQEGKTCCFCDDTKKLLMKSCYCCPVGHHCCPYNQMTRLHGPTCCKDGETCTRDGSCVATYKALASEGACGPMCRPDTKMYITTDNYMRLYLDGVEIELKYRGKWQELDFVHVAGHVCSIAVYGENQLYEAGILATSLDDRIMTNKNWKCVADINSSEGHEWYQPDYDDRHWPAAYESDINRLGHTRPPFDKISRNAYWIWSNNRSSLPKGKKWNKKAFCRYNLCH